ncbi:MAG: hypothetical protein AMJ38_03260, partial [Dehalococcoidia bacterium DG_22]
MLGAHFGTTDYLLRPQDAARSRVAPRPYKQNESLWKDVMEQRVTAGIEICLERFLILDWFPRAPGLYYTPDAKWAREEAYQHLHDKVWDSPIRDHAARAGAPRRRLDFTVVFTPTGKSSMLQGGVGCIRLKPIRLLNEPHWLMTATSDGVVHCGFPVAIPRAIYGPLVQELQTKGAVCSTVRGELEFVPDPFSRLFDPAVMVPRLYLRATELQPVEPTGAVPEASVAVSFVSEFEGHPKVYASYVTFRPDREGSFDDAVGWMKRDYVEGEYHGRIITDFDQTRTIFPEARLALSRVMDRTISRGALAESIELMHAAASADSYFEEVDLRALLPGSERRQRTKIFISYAHAAEKETGWVSRIRTHLEGLVKSSDFEIWDDSRIEPGQKWKNEIEWAIDKTGVAILVLTADFLASSFIREAELPL